MPHPPDPLPGDPHTAMFRPGTCSPIPALRRAGRTDPLNVHLLPLEDIPFRKPAHERHNRLRHTGDLPALPAGEVRMATVLFATVRGLERPRSITRVRSMDDAGAHQGIERAVDAHAVEFP